MPTSRTDLRSSNDVRACTRPAREPRVGRIRRADLKKLAGFDQSPADRLKSDRLLDSAVGHARVGCDAVRQQGRARKPSAMRADRAWRGVERPGPVRPARPTTLRALARETEQHGLKACWRAVAQINRVCSALTQMVNVVVSTKLSVHAVWPAVSSGQLLNLGSNRIATSTSPFCSQSSR